MRETRGLTINELLVVMAIIAILGGLVVSFARPSTEVRAANALKSLLLFARAQALWQGVAVSVTQLPLGGGFAVARTQAGAGCAGGTVTSRLLLSDFPGVRLASGFADGGLVWLPSGSGRSCDGDGVISATLRLNGFRGAAELIVSSLGRVRVRRLP